MFIEDWNVKRKQDKPVKLNDDDIQREFRWHESELKRLDRANKALRRDIDALMLVTGLKKEP